MTIMVAIIIAAYAIFADWENRRLRRKQQAEHEQRCKHYDEQVKKMEETRQRIADLSDRIVSMVGVRDT